MLCLNAYVSKEVNTKQKTDIFLQQHTAMVYQTTLSIINKILTRKID